MPKKRTKRVVDGPQPPYGEVYIKSGWCMGWENEINHEGCRPDRYNSYTNKTYICSCECHKGENREVLNAPT